MKQASILAVALLLQASASAQQGFVMAGTDAQNSNGSSSSSMGQIARNTNTNASGTIQEGLQQPYEFVNVVAVEAILTGDQFSVYPNPTNNLLVITRDSQVGSEVQLRLFDATGKLILEEAMIATAHTLSLQNLSPGVYYLRLQMNNQTNTLEIIKQ